MFSFLPSPVRGVLAFSLFVISTVFWCLLLYPFALLKIVAPGKQLRLSFGGIAVSLAEKWISANNAILALFHKIDFRVSGIEAVRIDRSYLICSNHRCWTDIVAIQRALNHRVPFIRFFLKQELLYIPLLGFAWWGLGFPFMKRYSKEYLQQHPEKRGDDLRTTRKASEALKGQSISILNFLEGTRFTDEKHAMQRSPYRHLLKPKTGGFAFIVEVMGEQFDQLLDITIFYPGGTPSIWQLFCGDVRRIDVHIQARTIPKEFLGRHYLEDDVYRLQIQEWLANLWLEKDRELGSFR